MYWRVAHVQRVRAIPADFGHDDERRQTADRLAPPRAEVRAGRLHVALHAGLALSNQSIEPLSTMKAESSMAYL